MLAVRSFDASDLPIDCLKRHILSMWEYLDRLRLGVSPGDTSEVFGQWRLRQLAWRWTLRISRRAEVGSESWRHKWGVWTSENSDNLPGDKQREICKLIWAIDWGWEWVLETQVRCLDSRDSDNLSSSSWMWGLRNHWILVGTEAFKLKRGIAVLTVLRMDNRTNTRPLREAIEDELIGWIIGLERVTSVLRLVQTVIVLLEWLLPLLEDVRLSANQRDIVAMLRDHLRDLEAEMQRQAYEMREHILGRYHRALRGWDTCDPMLYERCGRYRRWSSWQESWMGKISVNGWAACDVCCSCVACETCSLLWKVWWLWQWEPGESLGKVLWWLWQWQRAWRVTRKAGWFWQRERECLENH